MIFPALIDEPPAVNDPPQLSRPQQVVTVTIHKPGACILALLSATLVACGGNSHGGNSSTYTIGGAVTGLQGTGLVLRNLTTDLTVATNGTFSFPGKVSTGATYNVIVVSQPTSPTQVCSVTRGTGTVTTSNVTTIAISCTTSNPPPGGGSPAPHTIGGVVTGLTGTGLRLNDGVEDLPVTGNGAFAFPTALATGSTYTVTVVTQPSGPNQTCTVTGGSGTVAASDINDIAIACTTSPLSMTSSSPTNGATAISRTFIPILTFSATLDATTVTTNSVTLATAGGSPQTIAAQVSSLNQITVTPTAKLAPLTSYTLMVSMDVHGIRGEQLTTPVSVTFTTSDKAWQTASPIENNDGDATTPQIATNAAGSAVAVWTQTEGANSRIWASNYTPGNGWSNAVPIETDTTGMASTPQVAIDAQGNALAVWVQKYSNGLSYLLSNRYTPGGWQPGAVKQVETDNAGDAADPQIALDASGNAFVVWTRYQNKIWAVHCPSGGAWEHEVEIEPANGATIAAQPQIAVNASGSALAVWTESYANSQYVMANRYTAGSGWGAAAMISASVYQVSASQIAIDINGNGLAVWEQYDGTSGAMTDILSNRFTIGSGWRTARSITTNKARDAKTPKVAFDAQGNALALWAGTSTASAIWFARFALTDTDWEAAAPIGTVNPYATVQTPQFSFDSSGNAYAVWTQYISGQSMANNIASSRLTAGGVWTAAELIQSDTTGAASVPQITVDSNGNATAVWQQSDGKRNNIVANRFE